jgi:Transposase DDE domain
MAMVADSIPKLKGFLRFLDLPEICLSLVMRMMIGFLLHSGRMSCTQSACVLPTAPLHPAQLTRFLRRPRWRAVGIGRKMRDWLLRAEAGSRGRFILVLDATSITQQGQKTENTYSSGNRQRRPCKGRRYGKHKHHRRSGHSFTFSLLITPSGLRLPFQYPHYTKNYCRKYGLESRTTAQIAAALIDELPLPAGADVVVLGDTAYDAKSVQEACARRHYAWIVPCNPERVFAGPPGKRPRVRSLLKKWSEYELQAVRFAPHSGKYAIYRRLSSSRSGPRHNVRTFYVHQEKRRVKSVGDVQLVFSTKEPKLRTATSDNVKILMTNDLKMRPAEVVELYSLRWQIELFFKEMKSTLGLDQYRFREFAAVEGWVELAVLTTLYLEWYRAEQLARANLDEKERRWWQRQRTHGLAQAIRLASQQQDLQFIAKRLETEGGTKKLKRLLANAFPKEYRSKA